LDVFRLFKPVPNTVGPRFTLRHSVPSRQDSYSYLVRSAGVPARWWRNTHDTNPSRAWRHT